MPKKSKKISKPKQEKAQKPFGGAKERHDVEVVNIFVSASLGHDIPLEKMAATLDNTEYKPEQFPGLVYKLKDQKATFLLFSNGKVVCTGTKSEEEVHRALDKLKENLRKVK